MTKQGRVILFLLNLFQFVIGRSATLDFDIDHDHDHDHDRSLFNVDSSVITNNEIWYDNTGVELKANRGGVIMAKKINDYWYWVGSEASATWKAGGDIYLYKSKTLGSDSWVNVRKIVDLEVGTTTTSTCNLNQRDDNLNTFFIHCRSKVFASYNGVEGNYIRVGTLDVKKKEKWRGPLKVGTSSIFKDDDGQAYFVTSRLQKVDPDKAPGQDAKRFLYIYKLDSTWTKIDYSIVISWRWQHKEAPQIIKTGNLYYIFASGTNYWRESPTFFKRATSLQGLKAATADLVKMRPSDAADSMGSQFTFFLQVGDNQWLFAGRRHPVEAPESFGKENGSFVLTPAKFINGVPFVYWKKSFDWKTYDYNNPGFDYYYPTSPTAAPTPWVGECVDSTDRVWISKAKKYRYCVWARRSQTESRCDRHHELRASCPLTCGICSLPRPVPPTKAPTPLLPSPTLSPVPAPPSPVGDCVDATGPVWTSKAKKYRYCVWAKTNTADRCRRQVELQAECPVTCGTCP